MKDLLVTFFSLLALNSFAQTTYESKDKVYSFVMPDKYTSQASSHVRNEFIFVNKQDTTSLVVNVNEATMTKENLVAFKKTSNKDVENSFFSIIDSAKITKRGELKTYPDKTIYFHLSHKAKTEAENDYMLSYIFNHKGKEINFIFRTKARRLSNVSEEIDNIVNSVKLL